VVYFKAEQGVAFASKCPLRGFESAVHESALYVSTIMVRSTGPLQRVTYDGPPRSQLLRTGVRPPPRPYSSYARSASCPGLE
jgi:hypothetical protein